MKEQRDEFKSFQTKKEERHQKRVNRQQILKGGDGRESAEPPLRRRYSSSTPDLAHDYPPRGSRHYDDNPYAAGRFPPPPIGYAYRH
jgi:hypothetical protein